jgi:hypothetical protein
MRSLLLPHLIRLIERNYPLLEPIGAGLEHAKIPLVLLQILFNILYLHSNAAAKLKLKTKLHGLSPRTNYADRATAACRRSDC